MKLGYWLMILSAILFSTIGLGWHAMSVFAPMQLLLYRFLLAGVVLLLPAIFSLKKRKSHLSGKDFGFFTAGGFLLVVVVMTLLLLAENAMGNTAVILFATSPVFVIVLARISLREKFSAGIVLAALLCLGGLACFLTFASFRLSYGVLCALGAALGFAIFTVGAKHRVRSCGGWTTACFTCLYGGLWLLAVLLLGQIPAVAQWMRGWNLDVLAQIPLLSGWSFSILPQVLFLSIVTTGLGYAMYHLALEQCMASTVSLALFLKPAFTPLLLLLLYHSHISALTWVGIAVTVIGVAVAFFPGGRRAR